ncbi:2-methylisocitrate lyase-like PEP mutase family enzyme [Actinoplanes lutulentus]|uniref:2-methylisocitrate lyase-like PEP mutase family enzyme n=1 Tax=Actinoplanes lutulentus TaxID=1287878 RepID=A0A327Z6S5_9ACTN|nr:isocitrate lyase/phosphoenolpyruvate mutase family protein [Actinoplanes lutulentus]MBB2949067.1 2-methylisocitrate lyase-like PEP mutase family enzyme [Actinoplanes lutulentus]RAK31389.1 2-methylisocitrate lyase-like PEP mutase family enzyme [Actinoplanes lutulentus]
MTDKASILRELHQRGDVLVLPNAWDAASAALVVRAGAQAVATTSAGVAWSLGRPDGEGLTLDEMLTAVRRISAAVDVPVTADIESGYGDVAAAVRATIAAGAVGANIEDAVRPIDEQATLIRTARQAAGDSGFVINARTDVFLFGSGALDEVLARAAAYAEAGADCLFVPGLLDLAALRALTAASPLPVNAMAGPGSPSIAELADAGVRRVSLGSSIAQAAYGLVERAAQEALTKGTFDSLDGAASYPDLNALFPRS